MKLSAHQHLQISHDLRRASGRATPPLKGKLVQMANTHLAIARLKAVMQPMGKVFRGIGLQSLILFVMSALLLAIGVGQLRFRAWAGRWSVYWGVAGLVCVGLLVAISLLIISPAYGELFESAARLKPQTDGQTALGGLTSVFGGTFAVLSVIVYAPYPALMLLFFTRGRVRASMTG